MTQHQTKSMLGVVGLYFRFLLHLNKSLGLFHVGSTMDYNMCPTDDNKTVHYIFGMIFSKIVMIS